MLIPSSVRRILHRLIPAPTAELAVVFCVAVLAGTLAYPDAELLPQIQGTRGVTGYVVILLHVLVAGTGLVGAASIIQRKIKRTRLLAWCYWATVMTVALAFGFLNLVVWWSAGDGKLPAEAWEKYEGTPNGVRAVAAAMNLFVAMGIGFSGRLPSSAEGAAPVLPRLFAPALGGTALGIVMLGRYALGWDFFAACGLALGAGAAAAVVIVRPAQARKRGEKSPSE